MLVVVPVSKSDAALAADLLHWIKKLGRCESPCILVLDAAVDWADGLALQNLAKEAFGSAELFTNDKPVEGWIPGAHSLWRVAAKIAQERNTPWLWLEPDAIPIAPNWLKAIEIDYSKANKPFMGHIYGHGTRDNPIKLMSGVAVYPFDALRLIGAFTMSEYRAWDATAGDVMVKNGAHTDLIHHLWGEKGNPPRFAHKQMNVKGVFTLDYIKPKAVIFHRNKDGSLMRLLYEKLFFEIPSNAPTGVGFVTVFPFFNGDGEMAVKNAEWIAEISNNKHFDALMTFEEGTDYRIVDRMQAALSKSFASVSMCCYNQCPVNHWPESPNWAFQNTARFVHERFNRPWLWLEYDAIPVKSDWLVRLQKMYATCGKRFFGPRVAVMNHMNGVGIYPADFPLRCPKAMEMVGTAWDYGMKPEMEHDFHNGIKQIQHVWGIFNGIIHAYGGEPPVFKTYYDVKRWLYPNTLIFHRCKDGSLIDRLREVIYEDPHILQENRSVVPKRAGSNPANMERQLGVRRF